MNAGFSNLTTLKGYLLAATMRTRTDWDDAIKSIGQGVASAFENYCNRKFARAVADTEILPADKCQFLLSRYPIESISAIDLKTTESDGWVSQVINTFLNTLDNKAGIVNCPDGADAGPWYAQVRFTYTGGYFWEQLEPADAGYPTAVPIGAALVPADLLESWLLQCEVTWKMRDKLGVGIVGGETKGRGPLYAINDLDFIPFVKKNLGQFVRYNLT